MTIDTIKQTLRDFGSAEVGRFAALIAPTGAVGGVACFAERRTRTRRPLCKTSVVMRRATMRSGRPPPRARPVLSRSDVPPQVRHHTLRFVRKACCAHSGQ